MKLKLLTLIIFFAMSTSQSLKAQSADKPSPNLRIGMTGIIVNDPVKAHAFYTDTLGFTSVDFRPEMQLAVVASKDAPEGTSMLLEPNAHPVSKNFQEAIYKMGMPVIIFYSDDVQAEYDRLSKLGVKFKNAPKEDDYGTQVVLDDGQGNYVQIYQLKQG